MTSQDERQDAQTIYACPSCGHTVIDVRVFGTWPIDPRTGGLVKGGKS